MLKSGANFAIGLAFELNKHGFTPVACENKIPVVHGWQSMTCQDWIARHYVELDHQGKVRKDGKFYQKHQVGIVTGKASGVIVIDIDNKEEEGARCGMEYWAELCKKHNYQVETPCVSTPSGGLHIYYNYTSGIKTVSRAFKDENGVPVGIDVRADGGQAIAPGSYNNDKSKRYEWINRPEDRPIQNIPEWLFKLLTDTRGQNKQAELMTDEDVKNALNLFYDKEIFPDCDYYKVRENAIEGTKIPLQRIRPINYC